MAAKPPGATAIDRTVEVHHRIVLAPGERAVALTLDACGGDFDADLVDVLVENRVPATIFVTRRWLLKHPQAVKTLAAHPQLFAIENHGENRLAPVIGPGVSVYGVPGVADKAALRREVEGGAKAIVAAGLPKPAWFRGATALRPRGDGGDSRDGIPRRGLLGERREVRGRHALPARGRLAAGEGGARRRHPAAHEQAGIAGRGGVPGRAARDDREGARVRDAWGRDVEAVPRPGP